MNQANEHSANILIVDDDPHILESLEEILSFEGYKCVKAADGKEALSLLSDEPVDLILLDLRLPRINGLEVLKHCVRSKPNLPVVMISGHATIHLAVEATKMGAFDFLEKPLEAERTLITIRNALEKKYLQSQRDFLLSEYRQKYRMIGTDVRMQNVFALIEKAARVDTKVLITGESGTGKEMVARAIHFLSPRAAFPFIPVNCSAIPETLIESELFGHEKGAFTGAMATRKGRFQQADRGTLFLDEIGDMSLMMQAKILRVLEDNIVEPVGGRKSITVDVRIVAATHKNLNAEIEEGNFREDLFYRLNVIHIHLPPLRERKDDIRPLAEAFLEEVCEENGLPRKSFASNVWAIMKNYHWPGNVRELRNIVERAAVTTPETLIDAPIILDVIQNRRETPSQPQNGKTLREARERFERKFILETLSAHDGKIQETADALGIQRSHLWKKMKKYNLTR